MCHNGAVFNYNEKLQRFIIIAPKWEDWASRYPFWHSLLDMKDPIYYCRMA